MHLGSRMRVSTKGVMITDLSKQTCSVFQATTMPSPSHRSELGGDMDTKTDSSQSSNINSFGPGLLVRYGL
eukprot:1158413-Pelagomonas_calceolata.AAC.1